MGLALLVCLYGCFYFFNKIKMFSNNIIGFKKHKFNLKRGS